MKISIAMTTYNGGSYIQEQLDSFAQQTHLPDELIVTDDRSSDNTIALIESFAARAPFAVKIIQNPVNLGYGQNFSKALGLCTGDLVFLSDQDDAWDANKIAHHANLAQQHSDKSCFLTDAKLADGKLVPSGETKLQKMAAMGLDKTNFVMGCCASFRRPFLQAALPVPVTVRGHDKWLVYIADQFGLTVRDDTPLQLYRIHGNNTSDYFVNNASKTNPVAIVKTRLMRRLASATDATGMELEYKFYNAFCERLNGPESRAALTKVTSADKVMAAANEVASMQARLRFRLSVNQKPLAKRLLSLSRILNEASAHNIGTKSIVRDLIRPVSSTNPLGEVEQQ